MAEHTSRRRRRSGWGLVFAATTALGAAVAFPGDTRRARGPGGLIADRQHDVIGCRGCDPDAFAAAARRRVGQRLMASYDELYAEIVGDRDVLYDATAEAHHRIAGLLTSDSPPEEGAGWSPVDEPARREELSRHVGERQPGRYVVHLDDEPLAC